MADLSLQYLRNLLRCWFIDEHEECCIVFATQNRPDARLFPLLMMSSYPHYRFRALDGWQVADGVTGFGGLTLALSGVMDARSSWSLRLGLSETATLC